MTASLSPDTNKVKREFFHFERAGGGGIYSLELMGDKQPPIGVSESTNGRTVWERMTLEDLDAAALDKLARIGVLKALEGWP